MRMIFRRELLAYFRTPVGYVFVGVFLTLAGVIFYLNNLQTLSGEWLIFLSQLTLPVMLLCPVLTMRPLCEDRQRHADQLLFTSPVALWRIVAGKYAAAAMVMLGTLALTNVYALVMILYGTLYAGEWFVGYLGLALQSMGFLALDLFVTCFTRNQISAVAAGFGANFLLWIVDLLADRAPVAFLGDAMRFVSLYDRYEPFLLGQLSYASTLFYLAFVAVCLVSATHVLDARRFSRGGAA